LDIAWYPNDAGHPRLGLVVPRYGSTAVARNRLRRRLREIARRAVLPVLGPLDLVVKPRPPAYRADFNTLSADLQQWATSL
jgi:ribonuclease P protein component